MNLYSDPIWIVRDFPQESLSHLALNLTTDLELLEEINHQKSAALLYHALLAEFEDEQLG